MTREDIIKAMGESGVGTMLLGVQHDKAVERLTRFAALVAEAERKSKSHTLGHGEMEISLRREHNGELFEYRYRFTREQVLHGTPDMIENIAGRLNAAIAQNIHKRSQA
jgi:hemin uptake protein HemP